ncbi:MAG: tetratricopeptide repeat protein [Muribaculaceae bacterium]|nr:tetratricopeptide repeat protein [Muribaculaceae bacterium]
MKHLLATIALALAATASLGAQTFRPTAEGGTAIALRSHDNDAAQQKENIERYIRLVEVADSAVATNNFDRAQKAYRQAMDLIPDNPNNLLLLSNLGMGQHYAGDNEAALLTLTDAHNIGPKSVTILSNRATVLRAMRRYADAAADYSRILDLEPDNHSALFNRGYLRSLANDTIGAEADLLRYRKLSADSANSAMALAVLYSNADKPAKALPYYTELIAAAPSAEAYAARAMCHLALQQLAEAADDIASGMQLDPDNGELYYCRAYLNVLRYNNDDARADADKAAALGVDPARIALLFD